MSMKRTRKFGLNMISLLLAVTLMAGTLIGVISSASAATEDYDKGTGWEPGNIYYKADGSIASADDFDLLLHKNITGMRGSQATGDLEYDIELGVQSNKVVTTGLAPVDIILVLDRSGSMDDSNVTVYDKLSTEPTKPNRNQSTTNYYIKRNGSYTQLGYRTSGGWYYGTSGNRTFVTFEVDGTGANNRYQFYEKNRKLRINALVESANEFVDNIAERAKQSGVDARFDVISYNAAHNNNDGYSNDTNDLVSVMNNNGKTQVKNAISGLLNRVDGGTSPQLGLAEAVRIFNSHNSAEDLARSRIVVLFTDGKPTDYGSTWVDKAANQSIAQAWNLQGKTGTVDKFGRYNDWAVADNPINPAATVFTIGLFDGDDTDTDGYMEAMASIKKDQDGRDVRLYYKAGESLSLNDIFTEIEHESGTALKNAKIRDYIDPNFELTEASIAELKKQGATIGTDSNGQYVEWIRDINPSEDMTTFTGITVKPKEQTFYGDKLPTNGNKSGVYTSNERDTWAFPQPTVQIPFVSGSLTVTKQVEGNTDSGDRAFSFTARVNGTEESFTLKANESKTFERVQVGSDFWIRENLASDDAYSLTAVLKNGEALNGTETENNTVSGKFTAGDHFTFINRNKEDSVDLNKTASLDNWDDRTYTINLDASTVITTEIEDAQPCDIALVMDNSGSMGYGQSSSKLSPIRLGQFKDVKDQLDPSKQYYYYTGTSSEMNGTYSTNSSPSSYRLEYDKDQGKWYYSYYYFREVPDDTYIWVRNDRMCQFKDAACSFIDKTAAASPQSRVSLITFSSNAKDISEGWYTLDSAENIQALKDKINAMMASGSTYMGKGLKIAKQNYFSANGAYPPLATNRPVTIAFTDGDDNGGSTNQDSAPVQAASLKGAPYNVEIFTIGLMLSDNAQRFLEGIASTEKDTEEIKHALTADDTSSLEKLFQQISSSIIQKLTTTVRDTVDPRFDILNSDGTIAKVGDIVNGGTVGYDDAKGAWYIEWDKAEIGPSETDENGNVVKTGWNKSFQVKAKENFVGGNVIPTNVVPDSYVVVDGSKVVFPDQPTVNVKPKVAVCDDQVTIFRGEQVPQPGKIIELQENLKNTFIVENDPTGAYSYVWKDAQGNPISSDNRYHFPENVYTNDDTHYTLTVTFTPYTVEERLQKIAEGCVPPVEKMPAAEAASGDCTYTVYVKTGSIQVTKQIKGDDVWYPHGDPIFSFKLERLDENGNVLDTDYRNVRFSENSGAQSDMGMLTLTANAFDGLQKGIYRVTELDTLRYQFESCSYHGDSTNMPVKVDQEEKAVYFYVGCKAPDNLETDLNATQGACTFVNKKVKDDHFSHTDVVENVFTIKIWDTTD